MAGNDKDVSANQHQDASEPRAKDGGDGAVEGLWRPRKVAALAIQLMAVGGPIVLGTVTARVVSQLFAPHTSIWLVSTVSLGTAVAVSVVLARLGARLLPLALLLRMTMLFPDRAPNRFKVARRATSKDELARRLAHPDEDVREAATTLLALVTALGRHDRKTRGHSERVRLYCDLVGIELGLNESERGRLRWVGLLHDIGKLEVAAEVLNKPGKLSSSEMETVRAHPDTGAKLAAPLADWLGPWFAGIRQHHERFDGAGYPRGLAGEHISLAGRAVSVVDAFETMTAARSYKSPMTTAAARAELARCAGSHFDPNVVRAFLRIALPRLLWTMGPLTFLVNFPFLRWIPSTSVRAADVAAASVNTAAGAVGVTAVTVAAATAHVPMFHTHGPAPARPVMAAADHRQLNPAPHGDVLPGSTGGTLTTQRGPSAVQLPTSSAASTGAATAGGTVPAGADGEHGAVAAVRRSGVRRDRRPTQPSDTQPSDTTQPSDAAVGQPAAGRTSGTASPAGETPPTNTPPVKTPPTKTPPTNTPPVKTPPVKKPRSRRSHQPKPPPRSRSRRHPRTATAVPAAATARPAAAGGSGSGHGSSGGSGSGHGGGHHESSDTGLG